MILDGKGGTFLLTAANGKSLNYRSAAILLAKRQKPKWVELTVLGNVTRKKDQLTSKAGVTGEPFLLAEDPKAKASKKESPFQKLGKAIEAGKKVTSVTGRVKQYETAKPAAKKGKTAKPQAKKKEPATLFVTGFTTEAMD